MTDVSLKRFGRLVAIERTSEKRGGTYLWRCACDCGGEVLVRINTLNSGESRSCGCLKSDLLRQAQTSHGMYGTRTYKSWDAMIQRCRNPKNPNYKRYGALGIQVCERWLSFPPFLEDMGERPDGKTLDRRDASLGYSLDNCRWATPLTQARNKRSATVTFQAALRVRALYLMGASPKQISIETGIGRGSINGILYLGQVWQLDQEDQSG